MNELFVNSDLVTRRSISNLLAGGQMQQVCGTFEGSAKAADQEDSGG